MSTISPSSYHAVWSSAHETTKSAAAAAAASSVNLRFAITPVEDGEGDEGEEPGQVEVEPVGQHKLEADQHRGGERGELQDRLLPRDEGDEQRAPDDEHLEHLLDDVQVGHAAGTVLAPAPDREGRVSVELEAERALGEDAGGVERIGLEEQHEERGDRCPGEPEHEWTRRNPDTARIGEPERRQQERGELRPARERDRRSARPCRGGEPEAPDQKRGHDRVVRVRVRGVERERIRSPRERQRRGEAGAAEAPPDEGEPEDAEAVEEKRRRVRRPQLVPLARPP